MADTARQVSLPRLSAALYGLVAMLMAVVVVLSVHGMIQSVAGAARALELRATTVELVDLAIAVAKGEAEAASLDEPLSAWLVATAPDPDQARAALAAAAAGESGDNPRLVARQIGRLFDGSDLSSGLLQAYLFLYMRGEVDRGIATLLSALATRYDAGLERREIRDAVRHWMDGPGDSDRAAVERVEQQLATMVANETPLAIVTGAAVKLLGLVLLGAGAVFYGLRFLGDARRILISGRI